MAVVKVCRENLKVFFDMLQYFDSWNLGMSMSSYAFFFVGKTILKQSILISDKCNSITAFTNVMEE